MLKKSVAQRLAIIIYVGFCFFVCLYFYASILYPGGSQHLSQSEGFDWFHNYWCDLMSAETVKGIDNPGAPFAIAALVCLCVSITGFFFLFSETLIKKPVLKKIIRMSGLLSMSNAVFIFSSWHHLMIISSSVFALVALVGIIMVLYRSNYTIYKWSAALIILVLIALNVMYYSSYGLYYLPFAQKVAMALVILWVLFFSMLLSGKTSKAI